MPAMWEGQANAALLTSAVRSWLAWRWSDLSQRILFCHPGDARSVRVTRAYLSPALTLPRMWGARATLKDAVGGDLRRGWMVTV